jgi:hypothetical protein
MSDYLIVYQGGSTDWTKKSPEQIRPVMEQWASWFKELEAKGVLRNPGSALAPGGAVIKANGKGFVTDTTMAEVKELIGGFTLIQADSVEQACQDRGGIALPEEQPGGPDPGSAGVRAEGLGPLSNPLELRGDQEALVLGARRDERLLQEAPRRLERARTRVEVREHGGHLVTPRQPA